MAAPFDPFGPVPDPMIGLIIGNWVITQLLGRGGMGAVYLAQNRAAAHIRCVFKTILAHLSKNTLMIDRFHNETAATGRLVGHENIVELRDLGALPNGQMFMQFEYVPGVPLHRFLAEWGGRLSLHRALYLALQVCDALDFAHAAGVIHRDLKPENLLIVIQDHERVPRLVKIIDFGISKLVDAVTHTITGTTMGSPYYMAVEQYANAAEASPKSDVFSLAVIIWQMITGELPWGRHPEPGVLYHLQQTKVPTPPPEDIMPAAVARILLRCFSPDPDQRPTMRQLALDLAVVVPATDDAPSGGAILQHIVRRFLMESPELARTMPRSAMANPDDVAAQLWPPANIAALPSAVPDPGVSPPGAVPSAPVPPPSPAAPVADASTTAHASPHAIGAPAAPSSPAPTTPVDSDAVPAAATPPAPLSGPGSSMPVASPAAAVAWEARGVSWPKIAEIPTGLMSQRHVAQNPPTDVLAAMPRVGSIVAAAEIELAGGTPGPEPYAHAAVPRVVVSNTQLSQGEPSPSATPPLGAVAARPMTHPEPAPVLMLPDVARSASRRKLLRVLIAAVGLMLVAVTCFTIARRVGAGKLDASRTDRASQRGENSAGPSMSGTISTVSGFAASVDAGAVSTQPRAVTVQAPAADAQPHTAAAPTPAPTAEAGQDVSTVGSTAARPSGMQVPDVGSDRAGTPSPVQPSLKVSRQIADEATRTPIVPKSADRPTAARTSGSKTGTLRVEVEPWADVAIDGETSTRTTPVTIELPAGHHRVVLTKGKTLSATVDVTISPNQTTNVKRTW